MRWNVWAVDLAHCGASTKKGKNLKEGNKKGNMAIPKECKRLAEVDFPIAVVSKHSAREKSIRYRYPSTLRL